MSIFTKTLVALVAGLFLAVAVLAGIIGDGKLAVGSIALCLIVCVIGSLGVLLPWLDKKYPPPQKKAWEKPLSFVEQLNYYIKTYPGWPRWILIFGIALWVLTVLVRGVEFFRGLNG
ncbi:MAG: hypothetical protein V4607_06065 [Pseudomonadota bacterium]